MRVSTRAPVATVVVDARETDRTLERCIVALVGQAAETPPFDVIAITRSETATFATPFVMRTVRAVSTATGLPFDVAADAARGEICIFLGGDVAADPHLVNAHITAHAGKGRAGLAVGRLTLEAPSHADWYARTLVAAWNARPEPRRGDWRVACLENLSMPREAVVRSARRATSATEIVYALSSTGCDIRYVRGA